MNFASFAPFVPSSASPVLLPVQNLLRFLFPPSFAPSTKGLPISPKRQVAQSPAFLRPPAIRPAAIRPALGHHPTAKPLEYKKPCPPQSAATTPKIPKMPKPPCRQELPALRVVRMLELGQSPKAVGRMVISGRMADVCAELDRLVGWEHSIRDEVIH